jgi:hypothetical protein
MFIMVLLPGIPTCTGHKFGFGAVGDKVSFLDAIKIRRSTLALAKESPISDDRIVMIVSHAIKHAPSPFNVSSCRAVILFGAEHDKLWDMGTEACEKSVPPPVFEQLKPKLQGYHDAYGTVSHSQLQITKKLLTWYVVGFVLRRHRGRKIATFVSPRPYCQIPRVGRAFQRHEPVHRLDCLVCRRTGVQSSTYPRTPHSWHSRNLERSRDMEPPRTAGVWQGDGSTTRWC